MSLEWVAIVGATPEPVEPRLREGLGADDVTPGLLGFLVIFAVVLACIPLFRSMTSKLRRVEHRARLEEEAQEAGTTDGHDASTPA